LRCGDHTRCIDMNYRHQAATRLGWTVSGTLSRAQGTQMYATGGFGPGETHAENRALLIAASGYPTNIGPLRGPHNDVEAMWGLLTDRGFKSDNIRVLADGMREELAKAASVSCGKAASDSGCPTHAKLARALADLAAAAQRGDYVVLYFSGHGVQIPDLIERDKPDGLRLTTPASAMQSNSAARPPQ
jgi:metacaspase-1